MKEVYVCQFSGFFYGHTIRVFPPESDLHLKTVCMLYIETQEGGGVVWVNWWGWPSSFQCKETHKSQQECHGRQWLCKVTLQSWKQLSRQLGAILLLYHYEVQARQGICGLGGIKLPSVDKPREKMENIEKMWVYERGYKTMSICSLSEWLNGCLRHNSYFSERSVCVHK